MRTNCLDLTLSRASWAPMKFRPLTNFLMFFKVYDTQTQFYKSQLCIWVSNWPVSRAWHLFFTSTVELWHPYGSLKYFISHTCWWDLDKLINLTMADQTIDWMMFAAASTSDNVLRDSLVTRLHAYASSNLDNQSFNVVYNPSKGNQITGASRLYIFSTLDLQDATTYV